MRSSDGIRYGSSRSPVSELHPAASPAPATPATCRNRLRFITGRASGLEVARGAVAGDAPPHVAVGAPAHPVDVDRGEDPRHLLDVAVARLALESGVHVAHVGEVGVLGDLVDAHPGDVLPLRVEVAELLDLGVGVPG